MFKETVAIKVKNDISKYYKRLKELGYKKYCPNIIDTCYHGWIVLYINNMYGVFSANFRNYKEITQEEFFGESKMRETIGTEVLKLLVERKCQELTSFSAYDVTSILRKELPNTDISHESVRLLVETYCTNNNFEIVSNGIFRTFNKKPYDSKNDGSKKDDKKTTKPKSKLEQLLEQKKAFTVKNTITRTLQQGGKINLTQIVRDNLGSRKVYVTKEPNKVVVYCSMPNFSNKQISEYSSDSEIRFRTGFKSSSVQIITKPNLLEIIPN